MLGQLGEYSVTKAEGDWIHNLTSDNFVSAALNLVGSDSYTEATDGLFGIRFAPTADPSKFLGLIYVNAGQVKQSDDDAEYGFHCEADPTLNYTPGLAEMQVLTSRKTTTEYYNDQLKEMSQSMAGQAMRDTDFTFSGYMESLIYWDFNEGTWKIQVLNGGFNAGAGVSYSWNYNTWCGPVPFTATLTIGGSAQVGMDALSVAYYNTQSGESGIGTDFLTQLRIYLYLKFFAGVGFDYSVIAFKLGIYGQISMDMQFQWLNRPYMNDQGTIKNTADGGTAPWTDSASASTGRSAWNFW